MSDSIEIVDVCLDNVDKTGFFCLMSKPKSVGYRQKRAWLEQRFAEGLKIKILHGSGGRGFIEYTPGESSWRVVAAPGYLVIHCLWVVGQGKGRGYGKRLLQECIDDARLQGKLGVVMVSSDENWLVKKRFFLHHGFTQVGQAPPSFQLLVKRCEDTAPLPAFPDDWEARQASFGPGLTVVHTPQCPYMAATADDYIARAQARGLPARIVEFRTAQEARKSSPSAYGTFGVVLDGRLLTYHFIKPAEFEKRLAQDAGDQGKT